MTTLTFYGAAKTVTGSKYLLEMSGKKILVDCGLFQGMKELRLKNWQTPDFDPAQIDIVLLTHAHIDHSGYLPLLVKNGFKKKILCTQGTKDLCEILLTDSGRIHEEDAAYANRKGFSKHKPALPLYTEEDAKRCLRQFQAIDYDEEVKLGGVLSACFSSAGHILGASFVRVFDQKTSITFSGDLGRPHDLLMLPPGLLKHSDYLVMESTYGGRHHEVNDVLDDLEAVVVRTTRRGGVTLIPAFSVGRTQEVMYCLYLLRKSGRIPAIPIYLDSPMSISVTQLYQRHLGEHRLNAQQCRGMADVAEYIHSVQQSKELDKKSDPMILISGSGMLDGGRILHHLKVFGEDPKNTLLLTGFQGAGTRGARLLAGEGSVKIHGAPVLINAELCTLDNLSAHADQGEILHWLSHLSEAPRKVFITHGEASNSEDLKAAIEKKLGWPCHVPDLLEKVTLRG
jgi:metallo-beta-lactamase family protein